MADKSTNACTLTFKSNLPKLTSDMKRAINAWLEESASEIEHDVKDLSRVDTGQTKGSYQHVVESGSRALVGSPLQNAIWEEFGTGEYALNGDGRKGYWVYVKGSAGAGYKSKSTKKHYTLAQAKRIVAILRSKGLDAYYTNGKTPNRPLQRAFEKNVNKVEKALVIKLQGLEKE